MSLELNINSLKCSLKNKLQKLSSHENKMLYFDIKQALGEIYPNSYFIVSVMKLKPEMQSKSIEE